MATPAEVQNDMSALARYWHGRDAWLDATCMIAAGVIRAYLRGGKVDGRTVNGCLDRLSNAQFRIPLGAARDSTDRSLFRARETILRLKAEAQQ